MQIIISMHVWLTVYNICLWNSNTFSFVANWQLLMFCNLKMVVPTHALFIFHKVATRGWRLVFISLFDPRHIISDWSVTVTLIYRLGDIYQVLATVVVTRTSRDWEQVPVVSCSGWTSSRVPHGPCGYCDVSTRRIVTALVTIFMVRWHDGSRF
jgi:hypothetical protein